MAAAEEVSMAVGAEASMVADLVEDFTAGSADSTAVASGAITEVGVDLAGMAVGAVMAGDEAGVGTAGVTQAGDAAGVGVIPVGAGELASVLVGAGVRTGEVTRMRMAIPTIIPTHRITVTTTRTHMHRRTRIGITAPTNRVTTRGGKIRAIPCRRDRLV